MNNSLFRVSWNETPPGNSGQLAMYRQTAVYLTLGQAMAKVMVDVYHEYRPSAEIQAPDGQIFDFENIKRLYKERHGL